MKILFISVNSDPFRDLSYGALQRTHLLLSAFAKVSQVDVCAFVDSVESNIDGCKVVFSGYCEQSGNIYQNFLSRVFSILGKSSPERVFQINKAMSEVLAGLLENGGYDYIVVRYLQTIAQLGLSKYLDKVIVDFDDNPVKSYVIGERIRGGAHALLPSLRALAIKKTWKFVRDRCALSFCSDPSEACRSHSFVLHNVPIISRVDNKYEHQNGLLFVGALSYPPNQDGISRFLKNVWPELHRRYPDLHFRIAGRCYNANLVKLWNEYPGVDVLGYVEDISEEYRKCAVAVSPIYFGAGTNIKVLEAIAMGIPCVTTPAGFNGLETYFSEGDNPAVAENYRSFIERVAFLLDNPDRAEEMAAKSLTVVERHFNVNNFDREVHSAISSLAAFRR